MKHIGMYLILGAFGVALLSRPAAASGEMVAAGTVGTGLLGVLSGQYAGGGGSKGSVTTSNAAGNPVSLSFG